MAYKLRIAVEARIKIGASGLSRTAIVRLLAWVHGDLADRADDFRQNRVAVRPECFIVRKLFLDGGARYFCAFIVNDQQAGTLEVQDFTFERRG